MNPLLVEHTFVTTLSEAEVIARCGELLGRLGFRGGSRTERGEVRWARGRLSASDWAGPQRQPLRIQLEFDRGQVAVAASLDLPRRGRPRHEELLVGLLRGLEQHVAGSATLDEIVDGVQNADGHLQQLWKRTCRIRTAVALTVLAGVATLVGCFVVLG